MTAEEITTEEMTAEEITTEKIRTFSMIKPDAVARSLIGQILSRFEAKGLKLVAGKLINMTEAQAGELYQEHKGKEFYGGLVEFALSGPVFVMVLEGVDAVKTARATMGATNPKEAEPGTIRADFADETTELPANFVHGSDAEESAEREIKIFFTEQELLD